MMAFWVAGTQTVRGIVCLIKQNLDINILNTEKDSEGHLSRIDVHINELNISPTNVYALNSPVGRKNFFKVLDRKLTKYKLMIMYLNIF